MEFLKSKLGPMQDREIKRDKEFIAAMLRMAPTLSKKFHFLAKAADIKDDRKSLVEDLVALTNLEALINSRKEQYNLISCDQLIRIKAKNVWAEYDADRRKSFNHSGHLQIDVQPKLETPDPATEFLDTKIDYILEMADKKSADIILKRLEGYQVNEIAAMYNTTEGAITMQIQRLKNKIRQRH
jgi:DNA-directed RNA polymerase specialized sigma24 family protein